MVAKHLRTQAEAAPAARKGARLQEQAAALVDDTWRLMAPIMAVVAVVTAATTGTIPGLAATALVAAAMWLAWAVPRVNRGTRLRKAPEWRRQVLLVVHVNLPMLLFGLAIACWTAGIAPTNWRETIGAPVIVSALAAVILNRRIASIIAATVSTWLGVALVAGNIDTLLILAGGAGVGVYAAIEQVRSDRAAAEVERGRRRNQQRAEQLLHEFEESGQGWFFETDRRGALLYVSSTVGKVLGRSVRELVGQHLSELFQPDAEEGERTLAFHLTARSAFNDLALRAAIAGEERWWSINGRPLYDEFGNFLGFRGSGHDLTEKRRSQQHASRLAHFDSLTGLANRLQMAQTLERLLTAPNPAQRSCAIFLLDLDRFKQVNDTMGHPAGDTLLTQVAERLKHTVGEQGRAEKAARLTEAIRAAPFVWQGRAMPLAVAVGVAPVRPGRDAADIIAEADRAMYADKRRLRAEAGASGDDVGQ